MNAPRQVLERIDRMVDEHTENPASLAPERARATRVVAIGDLLLAGETPAISTAFASALARVVGAMIEHFPDNLFWDLEFLSASLLRPREPAAIEALGTRLVRLHANFGQQSLIRFRYTHDFLYGFDWARWVRGEPLVRSHHTPYSPEFLEYTELQAGRIRQRILEGDARYGPTADGTSRNPFAFARGPQAEAQLNRALAARGAVPLQAWRFDGDPVWDRDYTAIREEVAEQLGIPPRP